MEFCNNLKKSFVLFFAFLLLISFAFAELQKTDNILAVEENGVTTLTFQQSNQPVLVTIDGSYYSNAKPDSFINVVNGSISEANMTASGETTWRFGNDTIKVQEGMRVVYKNGTLEIFGKEDSINITQDFQGTRKLEFSNNEQGNLEIKGTNFNVDGIQVRQGSLAVVKGGYVLGKNSLADWKGLTIGNGKDLLLASSETAYSNYGGSAIFPEDLRLRGKGEDFTIKLNKENKFAHIDPRDNFEIKAVKDFEFSLENRNPDIKQEGKIPLMNTKGEFMINQDSKTIYTQDGKVLITKQKDGVLFNKGTTSSGSSTSPIELRVDGQKSKYIVSNFNGVATIPLVAEDGKEYQTDERYANSIYWKKASVENRYNYLTLKDLNDKITGREFNFVGMPEDPEIIRTILEVYEANPEAFKDLKGIKIVSGGDLKGVGGAHWDPLTQTIVLNGDRMNERATSLGDISNTYFDAISHEMGHNQQLAKRFIEGYYENVKNIKSQKDVLSTYENWLSDEIEKNPGTAGNPRTISLINEKKTQIEELQKRKAESDMKLMIFDMDWNTISKVEYAKGELVDLDPMGDLQSNDFVNSLMGANQLLGWKEDPRDKMDDPKILSGTRWTSLIYYEEPIMPQHGITRPYGANNIQEDVATCIQTIRSDPLYFKGFGLIDETLPSGEKSPFYDPRYEQKIRLLKEYGFITEAEYNAVFNPEKHFSPEEIAELMKKK